MVAVLGRPVLIVAAKGGIKHNVFSATPSIGREEAKGSGCKPGRERRAAEGGWVGECVMARMVTFVCRTLMMRIHT